VRVFQAPAPAELYFERWFKEGWLSVMKVLFVGDIVGKGGRRAVVDLVPGLVAEYRCGFVVANGENMAGGGGMTKRCLDDMADAGVDVFTGGDHMWDQRELPGEIPGLGNVLRPANVYAQQPGRGYGLFTAEDGQPVGVVCLLGRTFMNSQADCPFAAADRIVQELSQTTRRIIVDIHAEATSEKTALARFLDGRVSAVLGTHTHVPTADQQIFPGETAFQCDVGMVGARESVLGRDISAVIKRFHTGMPSRFTVVNKGIRLHATVVSVGDDGRATGIERVVRDLP
jgi:metallophosphoesterase (TIGR00282 family)